jgi:hypothetical protein
VWGQLLLILRCNWTGEGRGRCVVDLDLKRGRIVDCETNIITVHILTSSENFFH